MPNMRKIRLRQVIFTCEGGKNTKMEHIVDSLIIVLGCVERSRVGCLVGWFGGCLDVKL